MRYRGFEHTHTPDKVTDVMDSSHYRTLLGTHVVVNGCTLPHKHFDDPRDIALGFGTDGFGPFRKRKNTCWPMILFNYNLPPEIRFLLRYLIAVGIIPGPKKPHDYDSFLYPLIQELLRLEIGVHAFDGVSKEYFALRAYLILAFGDIPAISMLMRMKGHNSFCPCRMCKIKAVPILGTSRSTYYVPLNRSRHPNAQNSTSIPSVYDPLHLPIRTHDEFLQQANEVADAATETQSESLAKEYGIKGVPLLSVLSSLSFPNSFPYDFMHLIWENIVKNLVLLWTGDYKGLSQGREEYQIDKKVWEAVGLASSKAGATIPTAFGPRPPNVASDKVSWTADTRSFWILYLGPVLLARRFKREQYYQHFVDLVKLLNLCLQFEISRDEIEIIRSGFAQWVQKYEAYVINFYSIRFIH